MTTASTLLVLTTAIALVFQAAAGAQAPQPATPGPEHKRLGYFVGNWTTEAESKASPFGPAGKSTMTDTCEWFEGRFAVICRSEGKTPSGPVKSIGILSYSADQKVYTFYSTDNNGMTMTSIPRGTVKGDTWTYDDESVYGGQKVRMRVTIKELSPTAYTFKMEMAGPDGKFAPLVDAKSTKAK